MEKSSREGQINVLREQIHTEEANEEHYKSRKNVISQDLENYGKQLASYVKEREDAQIQVKDAGERLEAAKHSFRKKMTGSISWKMRSNRRKVRSSRR